MTYLPRELAANGVPEDRVRLRQYRQQVRRTAADVAALAGVSAQTVLVYERGKRVRDPQRIAEAYLKLAPESAVPAPEMPRRELYFRPLSRAAQARLDGLCTWCEHAPADAGVTCADCRRERTAKQAAERRRAAEQGRCTQCRRRPRPEGRRWCYECLAKDRLRAKRRAELREGGGGDDKG